MRTVMGQELETTRGCFRNFRLDIGHCVLYPHSLGFCCDAGTCMTQLVIFQEERKEEGCNQNFSLYEACAENAFIHASRALPAILARFTEETHGKASKRVRRHDNLEIQNFWSKVHLPGGETSQIIGSLGQFRACEI